MSNLPDGCTQTEIDRYLEPAPGICNSCECYYDDCECSEDPDDEFDPDRDRDIQRECQDAENAYERSIFKEDR